MKKDKNSKNGDGIQSRRKAVNEEEGRDIVM